MHSREDLQVPAERPKQLPNQFAYMLMTLATKKTFSLSLLMFLLFPQSHTPLSRKTRGFLNVHEVSCINMRVTTSYLLSRRVSDLNNPFYFYLPTPLLRLVASYMPCCQHTQTRQKMMSRRGWKNLGTFLPLLPFWCLPCPRSESKKIRCGSSSVKHMAQKM